MTISDQRADGQGGRGFGSAPQCPVCDAGVVDGDLCLTHRALLERDVPEVLVKTLPPKARVVIEDGYGAPDLLYLVVLFIFILILLHLTGVVTLR